MYFRNQNDYDTKSQSGAKADVTTPPAEPTQGGKEGAEGANDPTIVVVTPTEPMREGAPAQAAGAAVTVPGVAQQEIERLREESAKRLREWNMSLIDQVKNLMNERDSLMKDKGKLLITVEELGREASNNVDRANEVARENAALLKLADELKGKNVALESAAVNNPPKDKLLWELEQLKRENKQLNLRYCQSLTANVTLKEELGSTLKMVLRLKGAYAEATRKVS